MSSGVEIAAKIDTKENKVQFFSCQSAQTLVLTFTSLEQLQAVGDCPYQISLDLCWGTKVSSLLGQMFSNE